VVEAGTVATNKCSITVVGGGTIISGTHIATGSITAGNLAADSVTADKISVVSLSAIETSAGKTSTGVLTVDPGGNIHSNGKDTYGNTTPAFFLGWDAISLPQNKYKFFIGDSNASLAWDGQDLYLKMRQALGLTAPNAGGTILTVQAFGGVGIRALSYTYNSAASRGRLSFDGVIAATPWLETPVLQLYSNLTDGTQARDVIVFTHNTYPARILNFHGPSGTLSYSADFTAQTINANYLYISQNKIRIATSLNPIQAGGGGNTGEICWDGQFIYVCVATNTWRKAQLVP
jgi:hypothetical protein